MMYREVAPHPKLREHIKCLWMLDHDYGNSLHDHEICQTSTRDVIERRRDDSCRTEGQPPATPMGRTTPMKRERIQVRDCLERSRGESLGGSAKRSAKKLCSLIADIEARTGVKYTCLDTHAG
jgi:hypothetical protein